MKCINNLSFNDCADHCACLFIDADAATASPAALSWGSDSGGETCVEDYDDDGDDIYEAYGDGDGWSWGVIDGDQVEYLDVSSRPAALLEITDDVRTFPSSTSACRVPLRRTSGCATSRHGIAAMALATRWCCACSARGLMSTSQTRRIC